jgi:hypothetical protein
LLVAYQRELNPTRFSVLLLLRRPTHGKLKIAEFEDARLNPEDFGFRPNQTGSGRRAAIY